MRNKDKGGPSGCLQYFTGDTGVVASFNYPIGQTAVTRTGTSGGAGKITLRTVRTFGCVRVTARVGPIW